jgi:hypothetical protein
VLKEHAQLASHSLRCVMERRRQSSRWRNEQPHTVTQPFCILEGQLTPHKTSARSHSKLNGRLKSRTARGAAPIRIDIRCCHGVWQRAGHSVAVPPTTRGPCKCTPRQFSPPFFSLSSSDKREACMSRRKDGVARGGDACDICAWLPTKPWARLEVGRRLPRSV